MKLFVKNFFSKCGQIRRKLQIWSYLLRKYLLENIFFVKWVYQIQFIFVRKTWVVLIALVISWFGEVCKFWFLLWYPDKEGNRGKFLKFLFEIMFCSNTWFVEIPITFLVLQIASYKFQVTIHCISYVTIYI